MEACQKDERTKRPTWLTNTDPGGVLRKKGVKVSSLAKIVLWGCPRRAQQREQRGLNWGRETKEASLTTMRNSEGDFNKVQMLSEGQGPNGGTLNDKEGTEQSNSR